MAWPKGQPRKVPGETPASEPVVERVLTPQEEDAIAREHDRRLNAQLQQATMVVADDVRATLLKHFGEDSVTLLMREIEPLLRDPTRERRRRPIRPLHAAA